MYFLQNLLRISTFFTFEILKNLPRIHPEIPSCYVAIVTSRHIMSIGCGWYRCVGEKMLATFSVGVSGAVLITIVGILKNCGTATGILSFTKWFGDLYGCNFFVQINIFKLNLFWFELNDFSILWVILPLINCSLLPI